MLKTLEPFSDAAAVARYAEGPLRYVPGYEYMLRMARILIEEKASAASEILVLGAGGGLELNAFAQSQPGWTFVGVDPSLEMLNLATGTLGPRASRVQLVHGYIDDAPQRQFDAATCLLTFHFIEREERVRTAREVRARLRPGAPFVVAHMSIPAGADERSKWFARDAAQALAAGEDALKVENRRKTIGAKLQVLAPDEDVHVLEEAGFTGVEAFYQAFNWRGWVAYA